MEGDIVGNYPPKGTLNDKRNKKREHRLNQEYLWHTRTLFWQISPQLGKCFFYSTTTWVCVCGGESV